MVTSPLIARLRAGPAADDDRAPAGAMDGSVWDDWACRSTSRPWSGASRMIVNMSWPRVRGLRRRPGRAGTRPSWRRPVCSGSGSGYFRLWSVDCEPACFPNTPPRFRTSRASTFQPGARASSPSSPPASPPERVEESVSWSKPSSAPKPRPAPESPDFAPAQHPATRPRLVRPRLHRVGPGDRGRDRLACWSQGGSTPSAGRSC